MKLSVLFGGVSYEHEISIVSAITIKQKLNNKVKIEHFIFLDSNHEFYVIESENMKSKYFSSFDYKKAKKIEIGVGGFYENSFLGKKKLLNSGIILNLVHGADGEDGVLSGLLDFCRIQYIGPRLEASMLSYNKYLTKVYAQEKGIQTLPYYVYNRKSELRIPFEFPYIIKPTCLGSSIGINIAHNEEELEYAFDSAFEFTNEVIIEPFVKGVKEYNLAGAKIQDDFIFSIIEEPVKKDLLGFDDKYLDFSRTGEVTNADVTDSLKSQLQQAFKKIYNNIFEGALIRCDFFIIDNKVYLNEINPVPGSMANYLFSDFESVIHQLSSTLPKKSNIKIDYQYINKIQRSKGK